MVDWLLQITDEAVNVLVWSFDDSLRPKLMLESKREVTAVSFCPYDGNVVVGGCKNGQVIACILCTSEITHFPILLK